MFKRIVTGAVLVLILVPALIFYNTLITPVLWAVIAAVSLHEVAKCVGADVGRGRGTVMFFCLIGALFPFVQYVFGWGSVRSSHELIPVLLSVAFLAVYALYAAGVFGLIKPKLSAKSELILMLIYTSAASVSVVAVTQMAHGGFILPMVFLGSWITDSFAYFCGSFFGRHKLIPSVSPKKTVEGSIGGTLFCGAFCALYGFIVASAAGLTVNYPALIITGLLLSVVSQIGDLNASYIKRTYGIKDFGNLFPGHGGMLDRFDSVIASAPLLYLFSLFCTYFS